MNVHPAITMSAVSVAMVATLVLTDTVRPATWLARFQRHFITKPKSPTELIAMAADLEKKNAKRNAKRRKQRAKKGGRKESCNPSQHSRSTVLTETIYLMRPISHSAPLATLESVPSLMAIDPPLPPPYPTPQPNVPEPIPLFQDRLS